MSFTIPYVTNRAPVRNSRVSELILRAGQDAADGQMRSGAIWGNTVGSLGAIAAGAISQHAEQKAADRAAQAKAQAEAPKLADEAKLRGLSIREKEGSIQAQETERAQALALSEAFSGEKLPTPATIFKIMGPVKGLDIVKGLNAIQPDSEKKYRDQSILLRDAIAGVGAVPGPLKPEAWKMTRQNLITRGLISEDMVAPEYSPEEFARISAFGREPEKAAGFSLSPGEVRFGPDGKQIASVAPRPTATGSPNKMWVMRPGPDGKLASHFVAESEVQPGDMPANARSGEGRPSNGQEKTTLNFFNRAKQADEELQKLAPAINKMGLGGQARMSMAPNMLQSDESQQYLQAQRAFTEARLRKDSGAAIPEQEFENDRKTYFVQPGDTPQTIAQKERGRAAVLASLAFGSGRALNEFYGEDADGMVEGYKGRQAQDSGLTVTIQGQSVTFQSKAQLDAWKKAAGVK